MGDEDDDENDDKDEDSDHDEDDEDHHEDDEDDQYELDSCLRLHHSTTGAPGTSCPCANSYSPSSSSSSWS